MMVVEWIGQILLFFIFWRILHFISVKTQNRIKGSSIVAELVVNLVVAIVILIMISAVHSAWWSMLVIGAALGVITGQAAVRSRPSED